MEATLCRAWFDQVLTDTLAAAESLLRDWWSKLPRRRPLENRSGGKQEPGPAKANLSLTVVAGRRPGTADGAIRAWMRRALDWWNALPAEDQQARMARWNEEEGNGA